MATNFSPSLGSYVLNQFPSIVVCGMNRFYISASRVIQGNHGPLVENIVGKGEIARNEKFLLFPQCFQLNQIIVSPFVHIFDILSFYLLLNWKSVKLAYWVKA